MVLKPGQVCKMGMSQYAKMTAYRYIQHLKNINESQQRVDKIDIDFKKAYNGLRVSLNKLQEIQSMR